MGGETQVRVKFKASTVLTKGIGVLSYDWTRERVEISGGIRESELSQGKER